jgi:hypothetical protein
MHRALVEACLPWLALAVALMLALRFLLAVSGARWQPAALRRLHADEAGAVQSLSFVVTLPVFMMIMMLVVQVSQLMIATVVVHYAAFAATRAAVVWIPADVGTPDEGHNRISVHYPDATAQIEGPGTTYTIAPGGPKYDRIRMAAALACLSISPSRDTGDTLPQNLQDELAALQAAYQALAPSSAANPKIADRLRNKLAYSIANTRIDVTFLHKQREPPIAQWHLQHDPQEFYYNEVGWQDPIQVSVTHDLCLLPGAGRLLGTAVRSGPDPVAASIERRGRYYVRSLTASALLGNEGEKPRLSYVQQVQH